MNSLITFSEAEDSSAVNHGILLPFDGAILLNDMEAICEFNDAVSGEWKKVSVAE
jgi:hypothetical protein